jgi:hypothetical protein
VPSATRALRVEASTPTDATPLTKTLQTEGLSRDGCSFTLYVCIARPPNSRPFVGTKDLWQPDSRRASHLGAQAVRHVDAAS